MEPKKSMALSLPTNFFFLSEISYTKEYSLLYFIPYAYFYFYYL
jgi:hypothetical protein